MHYSVETKITIRTFTLLDSSNMGPIHLDLRRTSMRMEKAPTKIFSQMVGLLLMMMNSSHGNQISKKSAKNKRKHHGIG